MRKLHLGLKAQQSEKQSPGFTQLSNDIRAGNDFDLSVIGGFLEDVAKEKKTPGSVPAVENARHGIETRTQNFKERFDRLPAAEQVKIREAIQERMNGLEIITNPADEAVSFSEKREGGKRLAALKHLLQTFGEN